MIDMPENPTRQNQIVMYCLTDTYAQPKIIRLILISAFSNE